MVKVNDRFEFERDSMGWILYEWRVGVNPKTKTPTRTRRPHYYSNIVQVCNGIIDRSCDKADDATTIMQCVEKARDDVVTAIHGYELPKDAFGMMMTREDVELVAASATTQYDDDGNVVMTKRVYV